MSSYLAQAENLCMESAAALTNNLHLLNKLKTTPTDAEFRAALMQSTVKNITRLQQISANSHRVTRIMLLET